jgi:hypothetical protein
LYWEHWPLSSSREGRMSWFNTWACDNMSCYVTSLMTSKMITLLLSWFKTWLCHNICYGKIVPCAVVRL